MIGRIVAGAMVFLLSVSWPQVAAGQSNVADSAMKGDSAAVRTLIQQKADVNSAQIDGATALHWAVYRDDLEMADSLIRAGANVNVANRNGITPLYMASLYGHTPMIDRLIKAGADPKQIGPSGETMLMLAARNGTAESIRMLIAAGVDVNAVEPLRGTTALMWAAEQKHPSAVKALLEGGADFAARSAGAGLPRSRVHPPINLATVEGNARRYAIAAAAGRTYHEQLEFEARERDAARAAGVQDAPAGGQAAAANDNDVVIAGLVGGESGGLTALVLAAREGDLESAKVLLDAGADVNQTTAYGWTPLLIASNNRHYKLGTFLMDRGADPSIANKGGWTPLYLATDNRNIEGGDYPVPKPDMDHFEYIKTLLDHKANPNIPAKDNTLSRLIFSHQWFLESGATSFVRAAQSSDVALMRLLLSYGADPRIATDHHDTALTAAAGIGWLEGVTYERSAQENLEAVRMLLDLGLDPNAANGDGRTALMAAALKGRNEVVLLLLDHGAKLDTRDRGSRDTEDTGSQVAGHTWQALDYADGLVRTGVQSAINRPETAALIRKLMTERGMPVPPPNRLVESICIVEICKERQPE